MTSQNSSQATRLSLIERAAALDETAWRELVDLYGPLVAYWCRRCGRDEHATADLMQDVFTSLTRSLRHFEFRRESGAFRSWLWTITRNKLRDENRQREKQPIASGGSTAYAAIQSLLDPVAIPDDEPSEPGEIQKLVSRALAQIKVDFTPQSWQAFWRSAIDHQATDEVARELAMTPAAVRQVRSRVLRRLREQLGDL